MNFRFLDLFDQAKAILQEKVGTKTYWVFAGDGCGKYPYTTLITTKVGNKAGGYYGWHDKDKAIKYIQEKISEAKNFIEHKAKMRQENDLLAIKNLMKSKSVLFTRPLGDMRLNGTSFIR